MCWHFWKCKQMLWLWISTGWGLKPIHPVKSHCTKAFKSYTIQQDETAELFFWLCSAPSDLFNLCTRLQPLPPNFSTFIYLSFHILSQNDAPWEKREERLQHREQVTKNSNYVLQWSTTNETGAGVALKPQDTMIHTVQHKEKMTYSCTMSEPQTQRHIWIYILYNITMVHASCNLSYSLTEVYINIMRQWNVLEKCLDRKCSPSQTAQTFICMWKQENRQMSWHI